MIRKSLTAAALLAVIMSMGAASAAIDVCTTSGAGPTNGAGVGVSEQGVNASWSGSSGGTGGAKQCLHLGHP